MPLMPMRDPSPASYSRDRDDLWQAVRALERRLTAPAPPVPVVMGTVASLAPTVRVLGQSVPVPVWRITPGVKLAVGDEVCCADTALGWVVLSVVVEPIPSASPVVPSGPGPNLVPNPAPVPSPLPTMDPPYPAGYWFLYPDDFSDANSLPIDWEVWNDSATVLYGYLEAWMPSPDFPYAGALNVVGTDIAYSVGPTAAGASAIPVSPGLSYAASVHTTHKYGPSIVAMGVQWFTSSGTLISESLGAEVTGVSYDTYPPAWWNPGYAAPVNMPAGQWYGCDPTVAATAPTNAAYGRPFGRYTALGGEANLFNDIWWSWMDFHATGA